MSLKSLFSLKSFVLQYLLSFLTLYLVTIVSCSIGCLVSVLGQLIVVTVLSWFVTKTVGKYLNKEFLTSYKRAVLVTGCDSGFGNALAQTLNEHGFRVYATVLDTNSDGAKKLATSGRFDGMTTVLRMDVTNDEEVNAVYEQIAKELQQNGEQLWAVVNNAGIMTWGPLDWGTVDSYKRIFEVNTFGTVRVTRTFLPLIRQSKGRIVNLVSISGRFTAQNRSIYSMSKHSVISFADALRRESRKWGVKVSTIEPTAYNTAMSTPDYLNRELDQLWTDSSDNVKQIYGQEFYDKLRVQTSDTLASYSAGDNLNDVVDQIVAAIRSAEPEIRYFVSPDTWRIKLRLAIAQYLPGQFYDWLSARKQSPKTKQ
ncbi:D-beta-hydroxybutyrate dehydrogenase, mitochondrial-like [Oppia nitens]|uniref:D-beta-hydroxybutyrate dehydrogenase, mitochondrial-like n=1 Tax=Oppia nitens TaxID=1686743 RepID=UPI0023DCE375|nr:D-beta-hydroxybutyrate dehydrogenase, mitochondrial-like [Oppia nitens]